MQTVSLQFQFDVTLNCESGDVMIVPTVTAKANAPNAVHATIGHPFPKFWFARSAHDQAPYGQNNTSTARYRMAPTLLKLSSSLVLPPHPVGPPRSYAPLRLDVLQTPTPPLQNEVELSVGHGVDRIIQALSENSF